MFILISLIIFYSFVGILGLILSFKKSKINEISLLYSQSSSLSNFLNYSGKTYLLYAIVGILVACSQSRVLNLIWLTVVLVTSAIFGNILSKKIFI